MQDVTAVTCRTCGEKKPRDAFHAHSSSKLGIRNQCKQCTKVYDQKKYAKKHPESHEKCMLNLNATALVCSNCKEKKPRDAFHKNSRRVNGLICRCKECISIAGRDHYKNNSCVRERVAANFRKWKRSNPGKLKKIIELNTKKHKTCMKSDPNYKKNIQYETCQTLGKEICN